MHQTRLFQVGIILDQFARVESLLIVSVEQGSAEAEMFHAMNVSHKIFIYGSSLRIIEYEVANCQWSS
jgi:hypothetical protein